MKTRIGKISLTLAGVGLSCLVIGFLFLADTEIVRGGEVQIDDERVYPAKGVIELSLKTISADITFHEIETDEIRVHFHGRVSDNPPELQVTQGNGHLGLEIRRKPSVSLFGFHTEQVGLDIYLPKGQSFEELRISTVSANINFESLDADSFQVETISGDLRGGQLHTNSSWLDTTSGRFELSSFSGDLDFHSVSGDLSVKYRDYDYEIEADTVSGDLRLDLPDDASFSLRAKSVSGDINCDFPITVSGSRGAHELQGTVKDGQNIITVKTTSGDLSLF